MSFSIAALQPSFMPISWQIVRIYVPFEQFTVMSTSGRLMLFMVIPLMWMSLGLRSTSFPSLARL